MTQKKKWILAFIIVAGVCVIGLGYWSAQPASVSADQQGQRPPLTFNKDVAPIVYEHCSACHRPGESAPFSLLSYSDVKERTKQFRDVIESGFMPPWLPKRDHIEFVGERVLTKEQIAMIRTWVAQGAVEGEASDLPPMPTWTDGWQLGEPDLVVTMKEPFTISSDAGEVFHNFVVPIPVSETRYVKAIEFRPGNRKVVHHAELLVDKTSSSRRLDELHPGPGFPEMKYGRGAFPPDGHLLGWTPGKLPDPGDEDMAWRLNAGTDLVFLMHMFSSGKKETAQASVGLFFSDKLPTKLPMVFKLSSPVIEIPAGKKDYVVKDTYRLPVDVQLLSVYPHAHYVCKDVQAYARLPNGDRRSLIHIEDWDFNWQDSYRYTSPISLPRGTVIVMRYTYDNSADNVRNPNRPPQPIRLGPGSKDEMGDLWLQVLVETANDKQTLYRDYWTTELDRRIAISENDLRHISKNVDELIDFGRAMMLQGKLDVAVSAFQRAIGTRTYFDNRLKHRDVLLGQRRQLTQSEGSGERALEIEPNYSDAHNDLGRVLARQGELVEAKNNFEVASQLNPKSSEPHFNLGGMADARGDQAEAKAAYERALDIEPDNHNANNNLAWLLATSDNPELRDPEKAIRIAEHVAELTDYKDADVLDTLSVAYAAGRQFDNAIKMATKAIDLLRRHDREKLADEILSRLRLFKNRQPYRANERAE